jgi:hypothetical protein
VDSTPIRAPADDALHVGEGFNRLAVDADNHVPGLEAGLSRCAISDDFVHPGRGNVDADEHEGGGKHQDCQEEVGDRPRGDDGGTRRKRLGLERTRAFGRRQTLESVLGWHAGRIFIVKELDVASEGKPGHPPAGSMAVEEPEDLLAEADREGLDLNAAPASDEEMTELVEKDDHCQHEQKCQGLQDVSGEKFHVRAF